MYLGKLCEVFGIGWTFMINRNLSDALFSQAVMSIITKRTV